MPENPQEQEWDGMPGYSCQEGEVHWVQHVPGVKTAAERWAAAAVRPGAQTARLALPHAHVTRPAALVSEQHALTDLLAHFQRSQEAYQL